MIEKISVLAADIDGTLALKGGNLMPETRKAFQRLHKEGVLIGVASGRPLDKRIINRAQEWELGFDFDYVIGMNGGELYDKNEGEIEKYYQLKKEDVHDIVSFLAPLPLNVIVYNQGYDDISALHMDAFLIDSQQRNNSVVTIGDVDYVSRFDTGKIEVHVKPEDMPEVMAVVNAHPSENYVCVKTFEGPNHVTIEFIDPHINKGLALRQFSEKYNIPLSEFIAFGDMENDIDLLKTAGWGVCMINGADTVKAIAQDVTEYGVTEDGVGRYLFKNWFNR
ncbi:MAG: HAD family hydrolase [Solobacterium sp.]|nr:HAD family hydrolase [Solobacterium sp.]MCR5447993.1 HAD family hydrolase [Solobacterium sp.]